MKAILKATVTLIDGSTQDRAKVQTGPGEVELERIPNPYGHRAPWLALPNSRIGGTEIWWRSGAGTDSKDQVIIQD